MVGGNRGLWGLRVPFEHLGARLHPDMFSLARAHQAFDGEGRMRRAGLELWPADEDAWARRAAGEVLCGSSLDLGALRLDCAFFRWHLEGRTGVGRYDILRRAA